MRRGQNKTKSFSAGADAVRCLHVCGKKAKIKREKNDSINSSSRRGQRSGHRWASEHWSHQQLAAEEFLQENWVVGSHDDVKSMLFVSHLYKPNSLYVCSSFFFFLIFCTSSASCILVSSFSFLVALRNTRYRRDKNVVSWLGAAAETNWLERQHETTFGTFSITSLASIARDGADHPTSTPTHKQTPCPTVRDAGGCWKATEIVVNQPTNELNVNAFQKCF